MDPELLAEFSASVSEESEVKTTPLDKSDDNESAREGKWRWPRFAVAKERTGARGAGDERERRRESRARGSEEAALAPALLRPLLTSTGKDRIQHCSKLSALSRLDFHTARGARSSSSSPTSAPAATAPEML